MFIAVDRICAAAQVEILVKHSSNIVVASSDNKMDRFQSIDME